MPLRPNEQARSQQRLLREEDGVDYVDDAVGLENVGDGDARDAAFFVLDGDAVFAVGHNPEFAAAHRAELRGAVASLNGFLEILRGEAPCDNMIGEDSCEHALVFWFEKRVNRACRKFCESVVRWSEDCEWSGGLERVHKAGSLYGGD